MKKISGSRYGMTLFAWQTDFLTDHLTNTILIS